MKTVAFVPIRLNSQRVAGKNLRPLDGSPLMCHILKTLTEVEGIDEVYVFCSDEGIRALLPEGSGCCSATRRSTATRRSGGRFTTASPPGSGPTSTSSPTPPRRSSAPRPLRCARQSAFGRIRLGVQRRKNPDFRLVRRPSAQLRSRQHPPHADHRAGLHRDQRLLHLFCGSCGAAAAAASAIVPTWPSWTASRVWTSTTPRTSPWPKSSRRAGTYRDK